MSTPLTVNRHDESNGVVRLAVSGDIDEETCDVLTELVVDAVRGSVRELIIDVHHVSFLGSQGIASLLLGYQAALSRGSGFRVINAHGMVHSVLEISNLTDVLRVTTVAQASRDAAAPAGRGAAPDTEDDGFRAPRRATG